MVDLSIMRMSSRSLVSSSKRLGLAAVVVATAIILFTPTIAVINAQQLTNQPAKVTQNGTTLFESAEDSFRLQVPQGWVIHDVNNTGFTLASEVLEGYGILAELCPEEEEEGDGGGEQQQEQALTNVNSSNINSNSRRSCQQLQQPQEEIIHIVRYPNLDARFQFALDITANNNNTITDNILSYHVQKLQEVGYRNIEIVNNTETTVNVTNAQTNQTVATVPAKTIEMTYVTDFAPNQTRTGYSILTATNATAPTPGVTKGYSVFYEGNSTADTTNGTPTLQKTTTSGNLHSSLPASVKQVIDSFELIAAEEVVAQTGDGGGASGFDTGENDTGDGGGASGFDTGYTIRDGGGASGFDTGENDTGDGGGASGFDTGENDTGDGGGASGFDTVDGGEENDTGEFVIGDGGEGEEPTKLLTVDIISNGTEGIAPATFEFQADITGGTEPYTISWDFDDEEGSSEESEDDEQDILHTFDEAGTYDVTLSITDSEDLTASDSIEITIEEPATTAAVDEEEEIVEEEEQPLAEEEDEDDEGEEGVCDSSYPDLCIPPPPPDLDCGDDSVPENFQVLPPDPHGFDSDNDGIGCDSESNQAELEPEQSSPNDDLGTTNGGTSSTDDGDNNATEDDDNDDE
jgi:PKD repeat protein